MEEKLVYLCGPITGLSYGGTTNWRKAACAKFAEDVLGVSPMRGKDYLKNEAEIKISYDDPDILAHRIGSVMSNDSGITTRDRFDVQRCDLMIANFLGAKKVSIGSAIELGWADAFRKPVIMVAEEDNIHRIHPIARQVCGFHTDDLDVAIEIANIMLSKVFARQDSMS